MSRLIDAEDDVVSRLWLGIIFLFAVALAVGWYALRRGYFDHGEFEIKQAEWSPSTPRRVAVVAERSDHEAMSSAYYFVLITDHIPTARELRFMYYSDDVIFRAAGDCLNVHWTEAHALAVACTIGYTDPLYAGGIAVQKHKADDVAIAYMNIPPSNRN